MISAKASPLTYIVFFVIIVFYFAAVTIKYQYFDIYKLSLNDTVVNIRFDDKNGMQLKVSNKEHDLGHYWPMLRRNIAIGDSIYKKPEEYDIILVKKKPKYRIVCTFREK